jgi:NAD(P)-dependent dehydrogenase (short-subunit alcohol dehydrogenase family)
VALSVLGKAVPLCAPCADPNIEDMTTTLITGGNRGLGRETARRLVEAGHDVWLATRDPERGEAAAQELGARFVELDVTDERGVHAAAERVAAESGSLDVLVNNAGISGDHKPVDEVTARTSSASSTRTSSASCARRARSNRCSIVRRTRSS